MLQPFYIPFFWDLWIGDEDDYDTEHAHKVWKPTFLIVRVLRTEYSYSSSSSDLKVAAIHGWICGCALMGLSITRLQPGTAYQASREAFGDVCNCLPTSTVNIVQQNRSDVEAICLGLRWTTLSGTICDI